MLRELAEAVEALTAAAPLLLILDDVHWSDTATLDWLGYMARRWEPAGLLMLITYRPLEALARGHPLRSLVSELWLHRQCQELQLDVWSPAGVAAYLHQRFAGKPCPPALVSLLTQRTQGHPLFLVTVVDDAVRRGVLWEGTTGVEFEGRGKAVAAGVPDSLRQFIEQQVERLDPVDQALLETASVAGMVFSAATVAAGMEISVLEAEQRCAALARQHQLVQAYGTAAWPDGTLAAQYRFRHAFYHEVCYARVLGARRVHLHRLAETYRLQGELLLRQAIPDAARAAACFHQALAIARRQQAKSWELRAALSLSRLWQEHGKRQEAHAVLAPIYGWVHRRL
jgi:predicted ATPase